VCQCRRTEELLSILSFRDADDPGQVGGFHIRQINTQLVEIAGVIRRCCEWKARKAWCDQGGFWLDRILHAASYIGKDRNQLQCLSLQRRMNVADGSRSLNSCDDPAGGL
jgi:hypothetical protein